MKRRLNSDPSVEASTPARSMHEADDTYMDQPEKLELIAVLNALLEAERAGVRVTRESAHAASGGPIADLLRSIALDEAHWCAMLLRHLQALDATPNPNVGAFYNKAMAIVGLEERVIFLNRGQSWVVRKLEEILPRVRAPQMRSDLSDMLRSHKSNIACASKVVGRAR